MAKRTRVVLVEDNDVFRETLELLLGLRGDIEVVGSVASGAEAIAVCPGLDPDVADAQHRVTAFNVPSDPPGAPARGGAGFCSS